MGFLFKGLIAGFIIAMPLGPVSVLCFRRVLTQSRLVGIATVLGAATADTIFGLMAALGITAIMHLILKHQELLHIGGGVMLLGLGVIMMMSHPSNTDRGDDSAQTVAHAYLSAFLLMIANPVVVISFLAVFAVLDIHNAHLADGCALGIGLFAGSSAWWLVYRMADWLAGHRLRKYGLRAINVAGGGLICVFGLYNLIVAFFVGH